MKTKKQIQAKMKKLVKKADIKYNKLLQTNSTKNVYAYGQYLILKWVLGDSTFR